MSLEVVWPQAPSGSSSGTDSREGRLLQDRLRLFGGIAFLIAAAFYAVGQVLARPGREKPLTLDFGLVKDLKDEGGLSHEAALVGTPHYLAPEAIRSPSADARGDLYAVGAVGYFLLTGQHVFEGRTVIEICGHHLHTTPVPPSARLGRALPAALEAWVLACLEKDPGKRPQTAALAAAALERCAVSSWTDDEARSWWLSTGRALTAGRGHDVLPSDITISRVTPS